MGKKASIRWPIWTVATNLGFLFRVLFFSVTNKLHLKSFFRNGKSVGRGWGWAFNREGAFIWTNTVNGEAWIKKARHKKLPNRGCYWWTGSYTFIYLGFTSLSTLYRSYYGRAEETSTYSSSRFHTVNYRPTANGKQLPTFPLEVRPGSKHRSQRWKARVLPLCHRGPWFLYLDGELLYSFVR